MMKNVVCIGGGTGQSALLRGLKQIKNINLSAIVAVADNGGSTGRFRSDLNIPTMVDVRSVMDGKVIYVSPKTHIKYKWLEKGDIEQLTIEEILAMDTKKMFLRTPLLVVEDERIVEGLGLKGINELVDKVEDIDQLVEMDLGDMEKTINELPFEYKRNLRDEISKKIENSEIRDYVVVQTLKRIFEI